MGKALIIVESPAKIKTLKKFLGSNYLFASSVGHICDLPKRGFGIDIENKFTPQYEVLEDKQQVVDELKRLAKMADQVYLAPDPDREGEAIAWHIASLLPKECKIQRATFYSITQSEVKKALSQPREINQALVNAQQARRLLDRIVGYKISPLLVRRVQGKGSVSAGRVQSVALKIVVDRERAIRAFQPIEYWTIKAKLKPDTDQLFEAQLITIDGLKIEKEPVEGKDVFLLNNEKVAEEILSDLKAQPFHIQKIQKKEKKRHPVPPFITSTLQQEASRHHGFSSARTMRLAQDLYEGVSTANGETTEGLITYMRTDSVRLAPEAVQAARSFIKNTFGDKFLPAKERSYATKKSAQDAHEAIRPASLDRPPESLKEVLSTDQLKLYTLIWKRFIACQMESAVYDTVSIDIQAGERFGLRATGSTLKFSGFLAIYEEKDDDDEGDKANLLPHLEQSTPISCEEATKEQSFTKPPPRFSEASLVKELEKSGVGRPSTYATIMSKIQDRSYTVKEKGRLIPTELGEVICSFLENCFPQIMNLNFTAHLEDDLEEVAANHKDWIALLEGFWSEFSPYIDKAEKEGFVPKLPTDLPCPKCGHTLQKIWSKSRYFYGCSNYPDCDYTSSQEELAFDKSEYAEDFNWEQPCPICQSAMKIRHGRFGAFLGCSNYPKCRGTVTVPKKGEEIPSAEELPSCPAKECPGMLTARKSRFGKIFYSCSTFPDCNVIGNSIEEVLEKYRDHPRTAYEKKRKGAKKKATTKKSSKKATKSKSTKPRGPTYTPSATLQKVIGEGSFTRGEVTKKLWEYIKKQELQDPENKRMIRPDDELAKVFDTKEPVEMFQLAKLISPHLERP